MADQRDVTVVRVRSHVQHRTGPNQCGSGDPVCQRSDSFDLLLIGREDPGPTFEERGLRVLDARNFFARHRVAADEGVALEVKASSHLLQHRALDRANIGDDCALRQVRAHVLQHGSGDMQRAGQDHHLGAGDVGEVGRSLVDHASLLCRQSTLGPSRDADHRDARHTLAQRHAQGASDQPQPDNRDPFHD